MIPLGRSIPSLNNSSSSLSGDATLSNTDLSANAGTADAAATFGRRRSSLDAILGHLRTIGQFTDRVVQDFAAPSSQTAITSTSFAQVNNGNLSSMFLKRQTTVVDPLKKDDAEIHLSGV